MPPQTMDDSLLLIAFVGSAICTMVREVISAPIGMEGATGFIIVELLC